MSDLLRPVDSAFGFNPFAGSDFLSIPRNTGRKKNEYKVQTRLCAECESEHFMLWLLGLDEGKKPSILIVFHLEEAGTSQHSKVHLIPLLLSFQRLKQ